MGNKKNILKVRLGNDLYQVIPVDDVEKAAYEMGFSGTKKPRKSRQVAGMVDISSKTILIDQYLSAEEQDSTLLHELSHAVLPHLAEKHILQLETMLFPILNENGFRFVDRKRNRAKSRAPASSPAKKKAKRRSKKCPAKIAAGST